MKPKEITLDVNEKNGRQPQKNGRQPQKNDRQPQENERQPQENEKQPQENERQQRDRLKRQLLEEAKNKQLEKKMKKTARRKARNKKLPSIATSAGQTSTRPVYTTVSSGCCMGKTVHTTANSGCCVGKMVPSLQKEESMVSSDAFDHHKPLHLVNVDIFTNIDVNKSEDGITVVPKHQDGMMLESAKITPNEGQDLLKTHVSSTSAVPQHQQPVSACGHSCSMYCNILGDEDAVSPCNFDSAEYCETNQPFGQNTDHTTLHNEDDPILEGIDSDQPSMPCVSLVPSSSASDLPYIHKEAETEILSCLRKPQFQRHLPLNVGSMQLQRSLNNIILSHLLSQYYPETHTSKEDLKHCHRIVSFSKFLSQNSQQRRLQVMLTKSMLCALMNMHYCQRMFTSWPSRPVLKDISCHFFSSWIRSSVKKCYTTSSSRFKVKVPERVCEASGDKIDVSVCRCNTGNCQSGKVLKEMHTHMQYENDESIPTTTAQFVPCCNSFENTELTNVDEVSQNVEVYSLTAADLESCRGTHNHTSDEVPQNVEVYSLTAADLESCRGTHNHTSDEVPQNVEGYSLTAADRHADLESCQDTHNDTSDEVPQNVEGYSLTAADRHADLESCQDTHNDTSDEVPQNVEVYSLTAADLESCQDTHNDTSDEVPQNVEGYSLTAADRHADLESCQDTHNHTSDEVPQNIESYSLTASDVNTDPESCQGTQNHTSDEVPHNVEGYSLTATDRHADAESRGGTHNHTSSEGYVQGEHLLNERQVASDLWCPIRQEFVPDNWDDDISLDDVIDSASICATTDVSISTPAPTTPNRALFVEACIEIDDNEKQCRKQQFLDVEISKQNSSCCQEVMKDVASDCDNKPKQTTDTVYNVREVDKRKCCAGNDKVMLSRTTVSLLPHTTVMNMQQQRKAKCLHQEHQLLNKSDLKLHQSTDLESMTEAERNKSNGKVWLRHVVSNQSHPRRLHTAELLMHQLNDIEVEQTTEPCESISYLNKTFGALQNSSDMKNTIYDGVEIHTAELLTHQLNDIEVEQTTELCESISYLNKTFGALQNSSDMKNTIYDGVEIHTAELLMHQLNDTEVEQKTEPCESVSYLNKTFGALQNSSDMKKTIDDGVEIHTAELLTHQLNDTEVEQKTEPCESISYLNKIFGALQNSSDMKKTIDDGVEIHTAEVLTHELNDTEVEQKTEPCESISYLNKIFGALQNSSDIKNTIDDGVEIKRPEFNSSNNPAGSSKNSCADVVNLKEVMVIDHGKYELKYKTDIVENSLPSMGVPDCSATVNSGRDCSYHNIESACELENNVHRKWEFIPDSVLTVGTAEASVNQLITDYKCQQMADEFPRECLTQGNSDSLTYGECYTNKPIYNSALPVNNESTECSFHTNSSTNNSPQQFTTVHPTLFHPSTIQVASNNLCHVPTESDLNNLLALTLEKEQERLYLLLCDLQAKVLALEHIMKARNITKSPLAAGGDIDSLKRAGSLPSDKELSLDQIDAIIDKFVRVANKCFIPAIEHTSNKSIQWNQHVQNVQCGKTEKQADQRDLSDAELDNILKRLHVLGINDIKMPHTRWQSTAHSVNQSSQVGSLNRDRCFWDPQLQSRLLKWPPEGWEQKYWLGEAHTQLQTQVSQNKKTNKTVSSRLNSDRCFRDPQLQSRLPKWPADGCEQKYWLGEANTQLQTRVSQNKKTNKTVSSCQDGANHSIPRHDIPSRNSTDVTWSMQELQGQLQSGNPQKSYEKVGSFTTVNSPCNSAQENRTNIPKHQTPYKLLRRKVIRAPDCSLSEKKNRETETCPYLAAVALPSETGRSPPNSREPSKSFSLSGSALPVFRKNVAMQKTESSHCSHRLPSQWLRPVLTVSKTLPKKAGEFNSKDDW